MVEIAWAVLAFALGAVVAWVVASARAHVGASRELADLRGRLSAAESVGGELRGQAAQREQELAAARAALEQERQARVEAETRLEHAQESLQAQQRLLEEATARLTDTFKALSADALRSNNQSFLDLARQALGAVLTEARGELGQRQEALGALIQPLQEMLRRYEEQVQDLERRRQSAYGSLEEQLRALSATQQQLQRETGNLVAALRSPRVRGRWGETTLRRVVEIAGMTEHIDYVEQETLDGEARLRPDLVVYLPGGRSIVVDAKAPLDAYLDAIAASDEETRLAALKRHAQQLRGHMTALSNKAYWDHLPGTPEMVVMFIPGESFFAAAVEADPQLLEDGMANRVVLATPTTLLTVLRAVGYGWRQEQIAENARRISDLGRVLYERMGVLADHLATVGKALGRATEAYNKAVGSLETRVLPAARRFRELGAATGDEIPLLDVVEQEPRQLSLPSVGESAEPDA
ncbi:MAG: DNA recombination protein RmuC [Armatimonadota bacterium]|nr:DNA recombination protein RmuC [Armatimonadota bacterium]MDR7484798.1 DNA recombination protein RmuC [Armatimonadota bacterium]MDR7531913.1 DNA recombination protein RmuC [Armatimonadota bacterium]MDR7534742.1 DNA recombination protein RmuC [Armatimonadota bacterium]